MPPAATNAVTAVAERFPGGLAGRLGSSPVPSMPGEVMGTASLALYAVIGLTKAFIAWQEARVETARLNGMVKVATAKDENLTRVFEAELKAEESVFENYISLLKGVVANENSTPEIIRDALQEARTARQEYRARVDLLKVQHEALRKGDSEELIKLFHAK